MQASATATRRPQSAPAPDPRQDRAQARKATSRALHLSLTPLAPHHQPPPALSHASPHLEPRIYNCHYVRGPRSAAGPPRRRRRLRRGRWRRTRRARAAAAAASRRHRHDERHRSCCDGRRCGQGALSRVSTVPVSASAVRHAQTTTAAAGDEAVTAATGATRHHPHLAATAATAPSHVYTTSPPQ